MARKYIKAADLHSALLDAGVDILQERGIRPGFRVTLKEAIERAGVPRSSAYALLSEHGGSPVEQFHRDLLTRLETPEDPIETLAVIDAVLAEQIDRLNSGDPIELAVVMRELIRRASYVNVTEIAKRSNWRMFLASLAASGTGKDRDPDLMELHRHAAMNYADNFTETYAALLAFFGLRVVAPLTLGGFAATAVNISDSIALRLDLDPRLSNIERTSGPNGELQLWTAAGIAIEGLVLAWTEPDPEAAVSAALSAWTRY